MHICAKCFKKKKHTLYVLVLFIGIAIICSLFSWIFQQLFSFFVWDITTKREIASKCKCFTIICYNCIIVWKVKSSKSNLRTQCARRQCNILILVKNASPVKRGRGRPRKDSLGSNMSNVQAYFLDEGKTHRKLSTYIIIYNNYADLSYTYI